MSKNPDVTFEPFPGNQTHRLAYPMMELQTKAKAQSAFVNTQDGLGLLGLLVSDAEYALLDGAMGESYVKLKRPNLNDYVTPPRTPQSSSTSPTSNAGLDTTSSINLFVGKVSAVDTTIYNQRYQAWLDESHTLNLFRSRFMFSLDMATQNAIAAPEEFIHLSLKDIFGRLKAEFGTLSIGDINSERHKLTLPLASHGTLETLLDVHTAVHRLLVINKQPLAESQRITYLREALESVGTYDLPVQLFMAGYTLESKTHTFERLSRELKDFSRNHLGNRGVGQALLVKSLKRALPDSNSGEISNSDILAPTIDQKFAAMDQKLALLLAGKTKDKNNDRGHYCWSHGSNSNHPSHRCRKTQPGHEKDATEKNKMNGSTHVYGNSKKTKGGGGGVSKADKEA